jgi:hypothetical protein
MNRLEVAVGLASGSQSWIHRPCGRNIIFAFATNQPTGKGERHSIPLALGPVKRSAVAAILAGTFSVADPHR